MSLLLHERDGRVRVRCEACARLYTPGKAERCGMEKYGESYACICGACIERQCQYAGKMDRRRVYIPGGVISGWNRAGFEEYENSAEGRAERRAWEREAFAGLKGVKRG